MIQTITKEKTNYIDVTDEWLKLATPNSYKVLDRTYFEHNGIKYFVDGKNVVLDYSKKEKEVALWLSKTFGGQIYMLPRINYPKRIETPDYLWNKKYWDLKTISEQAKSKSRAIDNIVKNAKNQASNIILDISSSLLDDENIILQVQKLFFTKGREWLKTIMIVKNNKIVKIYKRI